MDDLIVLERYGEAEERLRARLKKIPKDIHSRVKLAQVYTLQRNLPKAVQEYTEAARAYAEDGFYDKGAALLTKAMRLAPADESLRQHLEKLKQDKNMEHTRGLAVDALRKRLESGSHRTSTQAVELEQIWTYLKGSELVQRLPEHQLQRLLAVVEIVRLKPGDVLVEQGSNEEVLYVIANGTIEAVAQREKGKRTTVRAFGAGDIIGEGSLLEHKAWPAQYRASVPTSLLKIDREALEKALVGNSDPRELLEHLRQQHHDQEVQTNVGNL